ncbi:MAG: hypothetical protein SFW35_00410 [Chitinophagales bacterium]|nr:hypothetical protein [Chitinophagales bacterium]
MNKVILVLVATLLICSCQKKQHNMQGDAEYLAKLQCSAKAIQNERFQLADDIRFAEDSSIMFRNDSVKAAYYIAKRDSFSAQLPILLNRTKALADTVEMVVDSFYNHLYTDSLQKRQLDSLLKAAYEKDCPADIRAVR